MFGEGLHHHRFESANTKSVNGVHTAYITDEVPTQAEIEKYINIGHIPLPTQFRNDLDKQCFSRNYIRIPW